MDTILSRSDFFSPKTFLFCDCTIKHKLPIFHVYIWDFFFTKNTSFLWSRHQTSEHKISQGLGKRPDSPVYWGKFTIIIIEITDKTQLNVMEIFLKANTYNFSELVVDAWLENPKRPTERRPSLMDEVCLVNHVQILSSTKGWFQAKSCFVSRLQALLRWDSGGASSHLHGLVGAHWALGTAQCNMIIIITACHHRDCNNQITISIHIISARFAGMCYTLTRVNPEGNSLVHIFLNASLTYIVFVHDPEFFLYTYNPQVSNWVKKFLKKKLFFRVIIFWAGRSNDRLDYFKIKTILWTFIGRYGT